ncbi:MAG: GntR family transcriptional regulator [Chloroflexi bacterium]|nr:GntR family transcriptional regulator [Chloroflexota bacterium]
MIQVDPFNDVPVYQQIIEQVRLGVARGQLKPGDKLEPVRQLAERLAVNPSTVARAYQLLEHDGIIETNRRRGSVVARSDDADAVLALRENRLRSIVERPLVEALAQGYSPEEVAAAFELQLAVWRERRLPAPALVAGRGGSQTRPYGLRFAGSHDLALEALWSRLRQAHPELSITASYVGSLDGLLALLHGEAGLVGAHILDEATGEYNLPILQRLFLGQRLCVVTLAEREQGLIVPPGNPLGLAAWTDLARPGLRFVNRQPGSGTRTLLDHHLRLAQIAAGSISGYDFVVPTHLAAAAAVQEGQADVALGLYAAARAYGLDFVPLAHERYDLICLAGDETRPPLDAVLTMLRTTEFRAVVAQLGGYDTRHTGETTCI